MLQGGFAAVLRSLFLNDMHSWTGARALKVSGQFQGGLQLVLGLCFKRCYSFLDWCPRFESVRTIVNFRGFAAVLRSLLQKIICILGLVPMIWKCQVNFRGVAAVLRSLFQKMRFILGLVPIS